MKLTKCPNGHFYDADKHPECPYCNGGLEAGSAIAQPGTAAEVDLAAPKGPVAGWLVVLDGPARGQDLRLGEGRNFLGVDAAGNPAVLDANSPLAVCGAALWCMTHRITTGVRCRDLPTSCAP